MNFFQKLFHKIKNIFDSDESGISELIPDPTQAQSKFSCIFCHHLLDSKGQCQFCENKHQCRPTFIINEYGEIYRILLKHCGKENFTIYIDCFTVKPWNSPPYQINLSWQNNKNTFSYIGIDANKHFISPETALRIYKKYKVLTVFS